jgi:hypothetical protein
MSDDTDATPPAPAASAWEDIAPQVLAFYRGVLQALHAAQVPFLVGGAFAFGWATGIRRATKDLDLFLKRSDLERAFDALQQAGYSTELSFPHWLAKVYGDEAFGDLIFNSGNGVSPVDDAWFMHAEPALMLGVPVQIAPVEETLLSKAFIMERERFDGADVAHLLRARAERLDWRRLLDRFGPYWRVLLGHLVLFGFIYPAERGRVPAWVMDELLARLQKEAEQGAVPIQVCGGTLLSREQYLPDVLHHGYQDGRIMPYGTMSADEVAQWTQAIPGRAGTGSGPTGDEAHAD